MATGGYDTWQQLRGFLAGLTKRVRTISGDPAAEFWDAKDGPEVDDGEWTDDYLVIHPTTLESLRRYFQVQPGSLEH
jgi:hypothetical protein